MQLQEELDDLKSQLDLKLEASVEDRRILLKTLRERESRAASCVSTASQTDNVNIASYVLRCLLLLL